MDGARLAGCRRSREDVTLRVEKNAELQEVAQGPVKNPDRKLRKSNIHEQKRIARFDSTGIARRVQPVSRAF